MPERREELTSETHGTLWGVFWWTLAALCHAGAVAAIIYFTPLRHWFFKEPDAEALKVVEGARLQRIVDELMAVNAERLREKVVDLADLRDEIARLRDAKRKEVGAPPLGVPARPPAWLTDRGFLALYDTAREVDASMYEAYRDLRAATLAKIQRMAVADARQVIDVETPVHPDPDPAVFGHVIRKADDGRLEALKKEVERIHGEVNAMITGAERILETVLDLYRPEDLGWSIAYESVGGMLFTGGGAGGYDDLNMPYNGPPLMAHEYYPGGQTGTGGIHPVAGRKVLRNQGDDADWMFIDAWYVIGPFPNPNRQNIDKAFPPEEQVDLDATYVGKDGRTLKWRFLKTSKFKLIPPLPDKYAVYYMWSELYSDEDRDLWVAVGSDDYAKLWVNDELVFVSDRTPHPWHALNDFRKVHFKRGFNKLLFRLDNAGGLVCWSVIVATLDADAMAAPE